MIVTTMLGKLVLLYKPYTIVACFSASLTPQFHINSQNFAWLKALTLAETLSEHHAYSCNLEAIGSLSVIITMLFIWFLLFS